MNVTDSMNVTAEPSTTTEVVYHCDLNDVSVTTHRLYLFAIGPKVLLGMILNSLNIVVLHKTKSSSNSFFMLQFMAFSDILYLFVCLLYFPIRRIVAQIKYGDQVYMRGDWHIGTDMLIVIDPLYHMLLVSRNWIVVVITIERLLNILFPFWARANITKFKLKIVIAIVFMIGFALHVPKWATWRLEYGVNECSGEPAMYIRLPNIRYLTRIEHYIYISMTVTAPMCFIYVANVLLVLSLRRSFLERSKMSGDSEEGVKQQRQAVIIVLAMSMVFTVFETPACIDRFLYIAGFANTPLTGLLRRGALILNITDSTVNFLAYCASSRPFRDSLMKLGRKK